MKNIPNRIYLQVDPENEKPESFNELSEITWCKDKINNNDIPYYRHNNSNSGRVEPQVSGKFAELADKLFKQYSRFNELPLMTKDEFSLCIKHLLEHIFESKFSR